MDDEPMWASDRVVALTPSSAITSLESANEFAIKALFDRLLGEIQAFSQHENESLTDAWYRMKEMLQNRHGHNLSKGNIIKIFYHGPNEITQEVLNAATGGIFLYETPNQAYQVLDWAKNQKIKSSLKKTVAFADEGISISNTNKIMSRMDAIILKMDAQYKELQAHAKKTKPDLNEDDIPMSREEEAKFMQTFRHNSQSYQPPQSRNEHVNAIFTRNGKSYNPPVNLNDQQNDSENSINFDSDEEDEEPTPQPKTQNPKPVKETPFPKPYKKNPYPQCLRKEKMEAQHGKFLDMIRAVRINVPLIDVLAEKPNCGKFLKELISKKYKIEQISAAFLSNESSAMIQNKVPPKLGDPESFLIPCNFNKTFSCNALADLAKNMLVEVGKFTFPVDSVIIEMEEHSKVPLILGRPFLHTADVVIQVKQKQLNLGVGTERMIFNIDSAMKHSYLNDDTCFSIDVIDEILEEDFNALLDECSKILYFIEGTLLKEEIFAEFDEFMAMAADKKSDSKSDTEEPTFEEITINYDYKNKTSLEEPHTNLKLKPLPNYLEYVFLKEPSFLPVIISSQLSKEKKDKLVSVLKKHKQAFAWKTTDIPDAHLLLNWEKYNFMVKEEIVLGHKVSSVGLEVDKAKIDVISKLPPHTNIKDTPFKFDDECQKSFELLKEKLTCAPVIVSPKWNLPFELTCDASDFVVGAILGQKDGKNFHPIYFASKTLNPA
nr:reverse transcriptase domain-containing protein [Tanacetum cinerariifolium]